MPEGGFFEKRAISPTGIGIVILLHGAAITALAMSKMEMPGVKLFDPLVIRNVPLDPVPDVIPPEPVKDQKPVPPQSQLDYVPPVVPSPPRGPAVPYDPTLDTPVFDPRPPANTDEAPTPPARPLPPIPEPVPQPLPKAEPAPVRVEARMRGENLQPPYPASEEQLQREGKVSVRVTIGADGRVKTVSKISATSDAFYKATEKHALRAWRFSPATLGGKPVESSQVLTLQFRLND